tara:strand:+ start:3089 stop:3433 length:345 start_codon:yes stop_codon:yes gene_type:complete
MAISRYRNSVQFINATEGYRKAFRDRFGEIGIRQLPVDLLNYPNQTEYNDIETASVVWKRGSRFYKLSTEYYGTPELWWVIAWFNGTPTEQHVKLGDVVLVPLFLDDVLSIFGL